MRLFYSNKKRLTRIFARFFFIIVCLGALFITNPMVAHAENGDGDTTGYGPWETEDAGLYPSEYDSSTGGNESDAKNTKASLPGGLEDALDGGDSGALAAFAEHGLEWVVDILSSIVYIVAECINKALGLGNFYTTKIDLSISGMMLGRVYKGADYVNWVQFELQPNNPFGIIGADCYALLRNLTFGFLPFMALYIIGKSLLTTDSKARVDLKELTFKIVICMFLLYLTPQIVAFIYYIRDLLSKGLLINVIGEDGLNIVREFKLLYYMQNGGILGSVLYLASIFATFTFLKSYISIALKQMAYFGSFPVFALLGLHDRKLVGDWFKEFISNAFIPTIDAVLISVPLIFITIGSVVMSNENGVDVKTIEINTEEMVRDLKLAAQSDYEQHLDWFQTSPIELTVDGGKTLYNWTIGALIGDHKDTKADRERKIRDAKIENAEAALGSADGLNNVELLLIRDNLPISFSIITMLLMGMVVSTRNALLKLFGQRIQDTQRGGTALMGALLMAARSAGRQLAPRTSQQPTPLPAGGTSGTGGGNGALGGTLDGAMSQMDNGFDTNAFKANPEEIAPTQKGPDPIEAAEKEIEENGTGTHNSGENINGGDNSEAYDNGDTYDETNTVSNIANENADDMPSGVDGAYDSASEIPTNDVNDGVYNAGEYYNNNNEGSVNIENENAAFGSIANECSNADGRVDKEVFDKNRQNNLASMDAVNSNIAALESGNLEKMPAPSSIKGQLGDDGKAAYRAYNDAYNEWKGDTSNIDKQNALKAAAEPVSTKLEASANKYTAKELEYHKFANHKDCANIGFNDVQKGQYNGLADYKKAEERNKVHNTLAGLKEFAVNNQYTQGAMYIHNTKQARFARQVALGTGKVAVKGAVKAAPTVAKIALKTTTMAAGAAVGMGMGAASGQLGSGATAGMMVGGALYNKGANAVRNKIDSDRANKQQQEEAARRQKQQEIREQEKAENNRNFEKERKSRIEKNNAQRDLAKEQIKTEKVKQGAYKNVQNHYSSNSQPNTSVNYTDGGVGQKNPQASEILHQTMPRFSAHGEGTDSNHNR